MAYHETKVYFDGSHYIAIPHTETPRKRGCFDRRPKEIAQVKRDGLTDRIDVEKQFVECEPEERVFDAKPTKIYELPDRKRDAQPPMQYELLDRNGNVISPKEDEPPDRKGGADLPKKDEQSDRVPDEPLTEKDVFNQLYAEHINLPRKERKKQIFESIKSHFEDDRTAELFVDANMERKKRNLISRRIRMIRKVNLQEFNYFVTLTYDSKIHTEQSFRDKLQNTLSHLCSRKKWRYIGVWERSPKKDRLHFHGLFYVPEGTMPGEMVKVNSYSLLEQKRQITNQSTYFAEQFGRNDFRPIERREHIGNAIAYILKYIEKSGERLVYSRGLPQFFISDILDDDVACRIGLEDKKLLLFDNFSCFDEGCYVGQVSPETIKQLRKVN